MITVACVYVQANVPYTVEYVTNLRAMVARNLTRPHRFVCLTDRPQLLTSAGVEAIQVPAPGQMMGWWSKLELFNSANGLTGRLLYLDLDTLIVRSLDPIVDFPAPFALVPHAGTFNGKGGLAVVKRFNSSVMVWDAGTQDALYGRWTRGVTMRLHGDQDWIGEQCPDAAAMPLQWFPRLSEITIGGPFATDRGAFYDAETKVILAKKPKNARAAELYSWFRDIWRAA